MMRELEIRCTDRHALNRYLDLRDILMRSPAFYSTII